MVRMVTCGLYKSLRGWQGPATLCLLPLKDHLEGTSHSPPWASPLVLPTSAPTSCRSMNILSLLWWPSYPWQLGICSDGYGCDRSTSLQAATPWIWALTWLQPQKEVWVWAGFTSSSSWAEAQLLQSPLLPEPQPTQVSLCPSQLELQIARQASQWQISLRAFTLPSAFARSSRACEMQMLSHLRVLFNQPQMLRLIEQWFA